MSIGVRPTQLSMQCGASLWARCSSLPSSTSVCYHDFGFPRRIDTPQGRIALLSNTRYSQERPVQIIGGVRPNTRPARTPVPSRADRHSNACARRRGGARARHVTPAADKPLRRQQGRPPVARERARAHIAVSALFRASLATPISASWPKPSACGASNGWRCLGLPGRRQWPPLGRLPCFTALPCPAPLQPRSGRRCVSSCVRACARRPKRSTHA